MLFSSHLLIFLINTKLLVDDKFAHAAVRKVFEESAPEHKIIKIMIYYRTNFCY